MTPVYYRLNSEQKEEATKIIIRINYLYYEAKAYMFSLTDVLIEVDLTLLIYHFKDWRLNKWERNRKKQGSLVLIEADNEMMGSIKGVTSYGKMEATLHEH